MQMLNNLSFIEAAAKQLIGSKQSAYNVATLYQQVSQYPNLKCSIKQVALRKDYKNIQKFNFYHITSRQHQKQPCIVYLHGLSSYSFQGMFLLPYIADHFSLCLYDLRSHGKNKNQMVTYGIKEALDLYQLVNYLTNSGVEQIYLWGRSMGASTILYFLQHYGREQLIKKHIKQVVLDSPYSSFAQIAKEIIGRSANIPYFISSPLVSITINSIDSKTGTNLGVLNFTKLTHVTYPAIFLYSNNDQVVGAYHSIKIIQGYGGPLKIIKGDFMHNVIRPADIISKVLCSLQKVAQNIVKTTQALPSRKGLSISLISCNNIPNEQQSDIDMIKCSLKPPQGKQQGKKYSIGAEVEKRYQYSNLMGTSNGQGRISIENQRIDENIGRKAERNQGTIIDTKIISNNIRQKMKISPKIEYKLSPKCAPRIYRQEAQNIDPNLDGQVEINRTNKKIQLISQQIKREIKHLNNKRRSRILTYQEIKDKERKDRELTRIRDLGPNSESRSYKNSENSKRSQSLSKSKSKGKGNCLGINLYARIVKISDYKYPNIMYNHTGSSPLHQYRPQIRQIGESKTIRPNILSNRQYM